MKEVCPKKIRDGSQSSHEIQGCSLQAYDVENDFAFLGDEVMFPVVWTGHIHFNVDFSLKVIGQV